MLRFGGLAAVGTAGAALVSVAGSAPADAAAGSKVVLGGPNDAGTSVTRVSSASTAETLRIANVADGGAIRADGTPTAAVPVIASTSSSEQPAIEATGMPVAAGGAVAAEGNGPALAVQGIAAFSRNGLFIVPANTDVATFNVPGGLTASSGAVAMTADPNGYLVARAIPDPTTGTLTLHMGGRKPVPTKVAWFVFG